MRKHENCHDIKYCIICNIANFSKCTVIHEMAFTEYGNLRGKRNSGKRHCHLTEGKPTYVYCWEVIDKNAKLIEVYYAGTHEKAPY